MVTEWQAFVQRVKADTKRLGGWLGQAVGLVVFVAKRATCKQTVFSCDCTKVALGARSSLIERRTSVGPSS